MCLQVLVAQRDDSTAHQATVSAPPRPVDGASLPTWPPFGPLPARAEVTALLHKTGMWAWGLVRRLLAQLAPGADPSTKLGIPLSACADLSSLSSDDLQRASDLVQVLHNYSTPNVETGSNVYVHCGGIGGVPVPTYVGEARWRPEK